MRGNVQHLAGPRCILRRVGVFGIMALHAAFSLNACGNKAAPRPPQFVRPRTITDLSAVPVANGIRLTWTRPTTSADGRAMPDLDGLMISRAVAAGKSDGPEDVIFEHIATIHLDDRGRSDRSRNKMTFNDRTAVAGQVYMYRVTAFTLDRYFSAPSTVVRARWPGRP